jgi:hypothetical protein
MEVAKDLLYRTDCPTVEGADLLYHPVAWTVNRQLHVRTPVRATSLIFLILSGWAG